REAHFGRKRFHALRRRNGVNGRVTRRALVTDQKIVDLEQIRDARGARRGERGVGARVVHIVRAPKNHLVVPHTAATVATARTAGEFAEKKRWRSLGGVLAPRARSRETNQQQRRCNSALDHPGRGRKTVSETTRRRRERS